MGHFVGDEVGLVSAPVYVVVGRRATQAPLPGSLILAAVTVSRSGANPPWSHELG